MDYFKHCCYNKSHSVLRITSTCLADVQDASSRPCAAFRSQCSKRLRWILWVPLPHRSRSLDLCWCVCPNCANPAKPQPELVKRYLQNSPIWHQFLAVTEEDRVAVDVDFDAGQPSHNHTLSAPGYHPDDTGVLLPGAIGEMDVSSADDLVCRTSSVKVSKRPRKRKFSKEESTSPIQGKINAFRADLSKLERECKKQRPPRNSSCLKQFLWSRVSP